MSTLETVDIAGIDLLAAGGPYLGTGSAPGGDFYSVDDLQRFAANATALSGEVRIPIKLGHSPQQNLLRESGLLDEHGAPAAGWIENVRVQGSKLVGDAKRVPAKLAGLINVGAFRTRSVEQRKYVSQRTGKDHGWVIDGLALLGGKAPAVRTLDDIVALYSSDAELPSLDGEPAEGVRTVTVKDASISGDGMADAPATLTLTPEQTAALSKSLGVKAEDLGAPEKLLAAIETATKTAATAAVAEIKPGLEKQLADANAELKTLKAAAGAAGDEGAKELAETLKALAASAEKGERAAEDLRVMRRDTLLDNAIRAGKLEPALRPQYVKLFDASPEVTRETIEALPKREDLFKTYGADGADITGGSAEGTPDEDAEKAEQMYRDYCANVGLPVPGAKAVTA